MTKQARLKIDTYLDSEEVNNEFDTDKVYDLMDETYIGCTNDYEESMSYINQPAAKF